MRELSCGCTVAYVDDAGWVRSYCEPCGVLRDKAVAAAATPVDPSADATFHVRDMDPEVAADLARQARPTSTTGGPR
jgi:hypothetical protein